MRSKKSRPESASGDPFARIERAADRAVDEVLEEDRLLREYGIEPEHGRSR